MTMSSNGLLAVSIHAGLSLCIFNLINNTQPTAYMDEIFHIPQAKKYCYGHFNEVLIIINTILFKMIVSFTPVSYDLM